MSLDAAAAFRDELRDACEAHLRRHHAIAIFLAGSLARLDPHLAREALPDADVILVDHGYAWRKAAALQAALARRWPDVKIDVGTYPAARLRAERSLLLYDLHHGGYRLAGADPKTLVPAFGAEDLFPMEAFRVLHNRTAGLLETWDVFADADAPDAPPTPDARTAARRARAAIRDARLIFRKDLPPHPADRERLAAKLLDLPPEDAVTATWLREAMPAAWDEGLRAAGGLERVLDEGRRRFAYPPLFRVATLLRLRSPRALVENPYFPALAACERYVRGARATPQARARIVRAWKLAPQPILPRGAA